MALYLISLCKNSTPIPRKLPHSLHEFIRQYNAKTKASKGVFDKEHLLEHEKKFEGMMNLLLKRLYDQESKLKEYSHQHTVIIQSQ